MWANLCRVWANCTRKSMRIDLKEKNNKKQKKNSHMNSKKWKWNYIYRRYLVWVQWECVCKNTKSDVLVPHCMHQLIQAVAEPAQLWRGFSPEWMKNQQIFTCTLQHLLSFISVSHSCSVVYIYHSFLHHKNASNMQVYLWGWHLLSGTCVMWQVVEEGLLEQKQK